MKLVLFDAHLNQHNSLDSSLDNFHNQIPYSQNIGYAGLGAIVLPQRRLIFNPNDYFGFRLMDDVYQLFNHQPNNDINYNAAKPLTDMGFGVGSKKESYFSFLHTQNFGKHFNFTTALRTARTEAFYNNQIPHFINFFANLSYASPNKKYLVLTNTTINTIYHKENGGITDTNLIDDDGNILNPQIANTNLNRALFKKNESQINIKQFYNLRPIVDTNNVDFNIDNYGREHLYHSFKFAENRMRFNDSLENFTISKINFDTSKIKQFLYHQNIDNTIGYEKLMNENNNTSIGYDFGITHSYNYISQPATNNKFNNIWLNAKINSKIFTNKYLELEYKQALAGYNSGDFSLTTTAYLSKLFLKQVFNFGIKYTNQLSEANYIQQNYTNELFTFKNTFNKIGISQFEVYAKGEKSSLSASISQIKNFVYFDTLAQPIQNNLSISLLKIEANHPLKFNKLHINSNIIYQKNLSTLDVLRLPELQIREQIYFEGFLFKHAMFSQVGIEFNYTSLYYGNAYMPLLNQFYLQYNKLVGGYPQLDFFFNFKIQQVRLFFKICNLNHGIQPTTIYYQAPNYPMYGRIFRLGLIWRFWD